VVAVDTEQAAAVLGGDAHDAASVGVGDLEVAVGEAAGQVLHRAGPPGGARDGVEQRVRRGVEDRGPDFHRKIVGLAPGTV
jgi:hypothetical protein